jgi:hypothetical protein
MLVKYAFGTLKLSQNDMKLMAEHQGVPICGYIMQALRPPNIEKPYWL